MEEINRWIQEVSQFFTRASIHIGGNTVSADSVIELVLILVASWWAPDCSSAP